MYVHTMISRTICLFVSDERRRSPLSFPETLGLKQGSPIDSVLTTVVEPPRGPGVRLPGRGGDLVSQWKGVLRQS